MTTPDTAPVPEDPSSETSSTTLLSSSRSLGFSQALRRLYYTRFIFAIVWAGLLFTTAKTTGAGLTALVVVYPLFDAAAVLWQVLADRNTHKPKTIEWINVAASVVVALALGAASTSSIGAALAVWGAWAICSGIPQLITAVRNRDVGGQVPQVLSGGISVLAGAAFLGQGLRDATSMAGAGGYAILGGVFFLISAIRLSTGTRTTTR